MMDDELVYISKIQKYLKEAYQNIGDSMIAGGIDNMEKYNYIIGQITALEATKQELSNLLNDKEQKNEGTIININTKQ